MPSKSTPVFLLTAFALTGCTSSPPGEHFTSVQQTITHRTGATIHWRTDSSEDAQADRAVNELLSRPLTPDSAAQVALLNNRHLQSTFEEIGIAQADLVQAGLLKNPVFDLGVRFPDRSPSKTYLDLSITSDFVEIFLIPARRKLAGLALQQAQLRVTDQILATVARTKSDFYRYQAAARMLDLRKQVAAAATASSDAARRLEEAGNINALDSLAEQTQDVRAHVELSDAGAETAAARGAVNKDLGLTTAADSWKSASPLPDPPAQDVSDTALEDLALRNRLDVAAARQDVDFQSHSLAYTRQTRFLPTLTAGPEAERETDGQWRIGPTFTVPVPLFDQGQAAIARQQSMLRQSRARYQALCADARSEVRAAFARLQNARSKAMLYHDKVLPLQQKLVEQTQLQFNGMFVGVFQLLQARRDQISAASEYIAALRDYWTARADLERATGGGALPLAPPSTQPSITHLSVDVPENAAPESHDHNHHGVP
jgi:cobalt-zinc-cadmium efflux system outer membrane protein